MEAVGDGNNKKKWLVPTLATVASVGIVVAMLLLIILLFRKKRPSNARRPLRGAQKRSFTYQEVTMMTNNFETTVGKRGFGVVYHGNLNGNEEVAVKILSQSSVQGYKEFKAERTGEFASSPLSWENRLRIATDTAQGLEYLHIGSNPPMIHRDIKSANILLDKHFHAKLGGFGLSRSFPVGSETQASTIVAGTLGYLDPEYHRTNRLAEKSDVYSFGVVLLEIITSQPVIGQTREKPHIREWVELMLSNGDIKNIVDPSLLGDDYDSSLMRKVLELAMSCVSLSFSDRPNMFQVTNELQECLLSYNSRKGGRHDLDFESSLEVSTSVVSQQTPDAR